MSNIRFATKDDIQKIVALDKSDDYYDFYTLPEILQRAIEREQLLVYLEENKITGYIRHGFLWDLELPLIEMIRVLPDKRGTGVATKLIQALIEKLISEDYESIVSSLNSTNTVSINLHEKLGFKEIGKLNLIPEEKEEIFYRFIFE